MNEKVPQDLEFVDSFLKLLDELIIKLIDDEQFQEVKLKLEEQKEKIDTIKVTRKSGLSQPVVDILSQPVVDIDNENELVITLGKDQDVDYRKHLLVTLVANTMSSNSPALKAGLASLIINNSIGYEYEDMALIDEENIVNLLSCCYGTDKIINYIVKNDDNAFSEIERKEISEIAALTGYNYECRKNTNISNFEYIQRKIVTNFKNRDDIGLEDLENLRLNLWNDPNMFQDLGFSYNDKESISATEEIIEQMRAEIVDKEVSKIK